MDKSLCGIPTLFAWSLAYGRNLLRPERATDPWRIRNVVAWCRPNPPVGALGDKFRPGTSYLTVATKARDRWFDLDAVRTAYSENTHARTGKVLSPGRIPTSRQPTSVAATSPRSTLSRTTTGRVRRRSTGGKSQPRDTKDRITRRGRNGCVCGRSTRCVRGMCAVRAANPADASSTREYVTTPGRLRHGSRKG
jgi:hypothetical protein